MNKVSKEMAEKLLGNVAPERCFWLSDGQALNNLSDLDKSLKGMKKEVFQHHVNKEKNDFANWIKDIVGDEELSKKAAASKTKAAVERVVKARVAELSKAAKAKQ